jgi:branched-chain amino acid transport system substrate-binding protein
MQSVTKLSRPDRWFSSRRRVLAAVALAAFPVLGLAPGAALAQQKELKIGVVLTVDGPWGSYGKKAFRGVRLAAEDVNKAGGVNGMMIKLVEYDNHANAREVPNIIRRLATVDNVLAIIGPFTSGEGEVGFPVANQLKIPIVAPATAKGGIMKDNRPWAFRTVMPDDENTAPTIRHVVKQRGIKSVVIFMDVKDAVSNYMGTRFWPALFKELGVTAETVTFQSNAPSVAAQASRVKSLAPDAVVLASASGDAAKVAIELRRQGVTAQLLGSGGLFGEEFIKSGGQAVEGAITAAQYWRENPDPKVQALVKSIEGRTGEKLVLHEAYSYDVVLAIRDAIAKSGVTGKPEDLEKDRERIRTGLDGIDLTGASGPHRLDPSAGEVFRPIMQATVKNGDWLVEVIQSSKSQ